MLEKHCVSIYIFPKPYKNLFSAGRIKRENNEGEKLLKDSEKSVHESELQTNAVYFASVNT